VLRFCLGLVVCKSGCGTPMPAPAVTHSTLQEPNITATCLVKRLLQAVKGHTRITNSRSLREGWPPQDLIQMMWTREQMHFNLKSVGAYTYCSCRKGTGNLFLLPYLHKTIHFGMKHLKQERELKCQWSIIDSEQVPHQRKGSTGSMFTYAKPTKYMLRT
jgi:hypothetical protein